MIDLLYAKYQADHSEASKEALFAAILARANHRLRDEDAAMAACSTVLHIIDTLVPQQTFSDWLSGVLRNYRSDLRKQAVNRRCQPLPDEIGDDYVDYTPDIPDLSAFPPTEQKLCTLILMGYTIKDAAKLLGFSPRTATKKLHEMGNLLLTR